MTEPRAAATTVSRWGAAGLALVVAGAVVLVVGWPRTVACSETDPICDGASGHEAFIWLGAAMIVAALYPLTVHAVVRALGLRAALDHEASLNHD